MNKEFHYTIYIKSSRDQVWRALTTPEFTAQYWGHLIVSDWKIGSKWEMIRNSDKSLNVIGTVIESIPSERLALSWTEVERPDDESLALFEIEQADHLVRLKITHSKLSDYMAGRISDGWPWVLSGLKSLIESGGLDVKTAA
jgi:uncharacterized protein YndB with AHSA1/START domain